MRMRCEGCDDYEKRITSITTPQVLAEMRGHVTPYPAEWVFKYCPWCGSKLEATND